MAAKITTIIIGMLLVGLFVGCFGIIISQAREGISPSAHTDFNLKAFDKIDNITATLKDTRDKTDQLSAGEAGVIDIIGGYFSSAYAALQITGDSIDVFKTLTDEGIDRLPLDDDGTEGGSGMSSLFKTVFTAMALVTIIIGVLIAAAVKRDL